MSNIEVVGLGALNIDHTYQVERILDDGEAAVNKAGARQGLPTLDELSQRYRQLYNREL